jgi:hypothetical protein
MMLNPLAVCSVGFLDLCIIPRAFLIVSVHLILKGKGLWSIGFVAIAFLCEPNFLPVFLTVQFFINNGNQSKSVIHFILMIATMLLISFAMGWGKKLSNWNRKEFLEFQKYVHHC